MNEVINFSPTAAVGPIIPDRGLPARRRMGHFFALKFIILKGGFTDEPRDFGPVGSPDGVGHFGSGRGHGL